MKRNHLFLVLMLGFILIAAGCGSRDLPAGSDGTLARAGRIISGIATSVIYTGAAISALAAIALACSYFPAIYAYLSAIPFVGSRIRTVLLDLIAAGSAAVLIGTCDLWIADHTWILTVAIFAGGGYLLLRFHSDIFTPAVVSAVETDALWVYNEVTGLFHHKSGAVAIPPVIPAAPVAVSAPTTAGSIPVATLKS